MNNEDEVSALRELVQQQQKRIAELEQKLLDRPGATKEEWQATSLAEAVRGAHFFREGEKEKEEIEPFI